MPERDNLEKEGRKEGGRERESWLNLIVCERVTTWGRRGGGERELAQLREGGTEGEGERERERERRGTEIAGSTQLSVRE